MLIMTPRATAQARTSENKAELREMLTEAVRNTPPKAKRPPQTKKD
jgi:hypothetical protein